LSTAGFDVVTPEMVPRTVVERRAKTLPKDLFWTFGRRVYGAAEEWLATGAVAGLVHLVSFGCGPDSLVGELVQRRAKTYEDTPFLLLTVDEHTGPAGVLTRLEAFADMIGYRARGRLGGGI
jgi:predicted nucleotide-binding protein (sugar kinase/HSP70/actin superfamily)